MLGVALAAHRAAPSVNSQSLTTNHFPLLLEFHMQENSYAWH